MFCCPIFIIIPICTILWSLQIPGVSGEKEGAQDISGTLRQQQITCLDNIVSFVHLNKIVWFP